ncbi:zinc finger protein 318-like [Suncus etruscus]|uniref:zinc finger protein 318-like n=1 Tax=Suncus etruscus TaxID=109475 RepID=UPI00210FD7E4|nr:zinc finger protein 318-like [Suncus etruscus]
MPEGQRLNDRRGPSVDNLKDVHRMALKEESVKCSPGLKRHISPEEGPVTPEILHHSDSNPPVCSDVKLLHGVTQNRDKRKGSYSTGLEESSEGSKRLCYNDTKMGDDDFASLIRSCLQHRQSHSPRFRDPECQELDRVKIKQENTEYPVSIDGVPPALEPGDFSHQPKELSMMPKKSILKKRIKLENTSSSQDSSLHSEHSSLPLSDTIADVASKPDHQTVLESPFREELGSSLCNKENLDQNAQVPEEHTDFLLPHERAIQDGSGFSRILSMLTDSTNIEGRKWFSFFDIEDEEKFLYGDEENVLNSECPPKSPVGSESEVMRQKASCYTPAIMRKSTSPERLKIHELVRTVGLDTVMSEISKLASSSQDLQ